jgi:hypothetical protein
MRLLLFLILSVLSISAKAQLFDSIVASFKHKPFPDIKFDTRNSFITARQAKIFGFKIGLDFNDQTKLGIGYNALATSFVKERVVWGNDFENYIVPSTLKFVYISPYFEYVFHRNEKWEHSIPLQFGYGYAWYEYLSNEGVKSKFNRKPILVYEPSMTSQYRIIPWLGVGVGLGYRLVLINNSAFDENFNAPVYVLRTRIYLELLYRSIFPEKKE